MAPHPSPVSKQILIVGIPLYRSGFRQIEIAAQLANKAVATASETAACPNEGAKSEAIVETHVAMANRNPHVAPGAMRRPRVRGGT